MTTATKKRQQPNEATIAQDRTTVQDSVDTSTALALTQQ